MEANIRHEVVRRLLDVTVFEAGEPIKMFHSLSLSSGKILNVEARQMLRWERQISKLFVQKLDKDGGHKNIIEPQDLLAARFTHSIDVDGTDIAITSQDLLAASFAHSTAGLCTSKMYLKDNSTSQ
ncbi:hypothetical protein POM88_038778 [Heracleum sosnowskyi]|uniref:Uncharacterized protein n=1 Tax=Heracleum sosnowskyi TaxID=360622 RepID=A0AAD8H8M5_9APIA|nr:hypothetical protein POM88_038778 [Heracleum sosnowskyi]